MLFREKLRFYLIGVQYECFLSSDRLQLFICLKKKSFFMSLMKINISPDFIWGSWFATHGLISEVYILKLGMQKFFKIWLRFTVFPSCFPILPLYTALAKLKCLSFTVKHLYLPRSSSLSMLFPTWALHIKIVYDSAQMSPPILSLFLNLQLELTLYFFENPQDRCCYFRSLVCFMTQILEHKCHGSFILVFLSAYSMNRCSTNNCRIQDWTQRENYSC